MSGNTVGQITPAPAPTDELVAVDPPRERRPVAAFSTALMATGEAIYVVVCDDGSVWWAGPEEWLPGKKPRGGWTESVAVPGTRRAQEQEATQ